MKIHFVLKIEITRCQSLKNALLQGYWQDLQWKSVVKKPSAKYPTPNEFLLRSK